MKYLKKLTQSVTMILVVVIVVGTPMLMGRVLGWLGVVSWLDRLWMPNLAGWFFTILPRVILAACWVAGDYFLIDRGEKAGWFWFKSSYSYRSKEEPSADKSGTIVGVVGVAVLVLVLFEFFFRVGAWSNPPYLPPPGG